MRIKEATRLGEGLVPGAPEQKRQGTRAEGDESLPGTPVRDQEVPLQRNRARARGADGEIAEVCLVDREVPRDRKVIGQGQRGAAGASLYKVQIVKGDQAVGGEGR